MAQGSIKIGSIFGIDIELHWLFILLILVFIWISPLLGLIWILLFVCVLIHELSHSVTALRNGIKVSRIILLPIGGASIIDLVEIDPKVEFNISIAGPITSLALGGLFGILVAFTPMGILTYIVQYLFVINILLGLFNLLPAFPMDGGRVLRSYLQKKKNFYDATILTAKVSRYFMALIIIATAIWVLLPTGSTANKETMFIWDLIIVFFLYEGMRAEEGNAQIRNETKGMKLRDVISGNYSLIGWNASAGSLYSLIKRRGEHIMLTKSPAGTYCLVNVFDQNAISKARRVCDLAIDIPNLQHSAGMADALASIESTQFRIGAVLNGRKLIGIATGQRMTALINLRMSGKIPRKGFK